VERHELQNGLVVLFRRDSSAPVAAIVTFVAAGYFDESDEVVGISHVLEHMYFKGTPRRGVGEIARETRARGGYLNAHTTYDHTAYFAVLPVAALEQGLDIQSDAFRNSLIDAGELSRETEVIIQEAKRKLDSPSAVAVETLYGIMHDEHRMRRWRIGTEEGLRRLTQGDVAAFYRGYYKPRNTVLAIVGDAPTGKMLALAQRYYGDLSDQACDRDRGPQRRGKPGFRVREWEGDVTQTQVVLGWQSPATLHDDTAALDVLAVILGAGRYSRLYRQVREARLASHVSASNYTPVELGVFIIHLEGAAEKATDALNASWLEVEAIRRGGVTDREIARARGMLRAQWLRRMENMDGQAMWLASWESLGDFAAGDRYMTDLLSVNAGDIARVADRYLAPDQASLVVYRPRGARPAGIVSPPSSSAVQEPGSTASGAGTEQSSRPSLGKPHLERVSGSVSIFRSSHGVPVLVRRRKGAPLVHASLHFEGGAGDELPGQFGISTLMTRAALKGSARRSASELALALETLGGAISPFCGIEGFGWGVSVPADHLADALAILGEIVLTPTFPPDALEAERTALLGDLALARDDMHGYPIRLALKAAFPDHPYGRSAMGADSDVKAIGREAVVAWHESSVRGGAAAMGIVGDSDEASLAAILLGALPALGLREGGAIPAPVWPPAQRIVAEARDKAQSAIAVVLPSAGRRDADRYAANMVATIGSGLGGRFFDELRERRSLAYTVHATTIERRASGAFVCYIATSPEREKEATEGMLAELQKLVNEDVSAAEIDRAREYTVGARAIRLQSGAAVLSEMMDAWLNAGDIDSLELTEARVRAVSLTDVRAFAGSHFDVTRPALGIVRGTGRSV
jgi:zinc protease